MNLIATLLFVVLAGPLAAEGQPAGKVARIGYLRDSSGHVASRFAEAFRQGLRDLGYVEGQTVVIEYRRAEGRYDRLPALAAELVRLRMDVIFAPATPAALAARKATTTIPIVTATVFDPVGAGVVASLGRPGGNVTGLTAFVGPEIVGKRLELFKEVIPKLSLVAVLGNPAHPAHTLLVRETNVAAGVLGVELRLLEARGPAEFEGAFRPMANARADGLLVLGDPMLFSHGARLADLAGKTRLPTMFGTREAVEAGGLMAYGASVPDLYRRAAMFVDKILRGAKPAELPVEQPTKFELIINLNELAT